MSWRDLAAVAVLCGVGFTMSLYLGALAFGAGPLAAGVKVGVLAGSLLSAIAGTAVLLRRRRQNDGEIVTSGQHLRATSRT